MGQFRILITVHGVVYFMEKFTISAHYDGLKMCNAQNVCAQYWAHMCVGPSFGMLPFVW